MADQKKWHQHKTNRAALVNAVIAGALAGCGALPWVYAIPWIGQALTAIFLRQGVEKMKE